MATVRDLLNRLRWDAEAKRSGVVVEVRTRDAGVERVETVAFETVSAILARGVALADGTYLPYHRFVRVRRGSEVLWRAREGA